MKFIQREFPYECRWSMWEFTKFMVWNGGPVPQIYVWEGNDPPGPLSRRLWLTTKEFDEKP